MGRKVAFCYPRFQAPPRFSAPNPRAPQQAYAGVVAREHSSGERTWRGGITKTGNAHLRHIVVEAGWSYRHRPTVGTALKKRQGPLTEDVKEIAWKAQHRLHARYRLLTGRGKSKAQAAPSA